jgi:signal transduction histidine kinase
VARTPAHTGLPWTLVAPVSPGPLPEFSGRRNILLTGLIALLMLLAAGSYFVWRFLTRELAVSRLQSDFVSAVSHEFRTPLTALRQFTEILLDTDDVPLEKRRGYYRAQARATDRLSRLVESLLDFGRMEAGRRPYRFEPLDAADFAANVLSEFREEPAARTFSFHYDDPRRPLLVEADPEALGRALWNLLDNAVKYSAGGREIELACRTENASVAISIRDHGEGIPRMEQAAIFDRFVRGHNARRHGIKGTGIGLAMVRHIVESHGGAVRLESEAGQGSTFTILLPSKS